MHDIDAWYCLTELLHVMQCKAQLHSTLWLAGCMCQRTVQSLQVHKLKQLAVQLESFQPASQLLWLTEQDPTQADT